MNKKYYLIYKKHADNSSAPLYLVEDKNIADDFCNLTNEFFYIEREVKKNDRS